MVIGTLVLLPRNKAGMITIGPVFLCIALLRKYLFKVPNCNFWQVPIIFFKGSRLNVVLETWEVSALKKSGRSFLGLFSCATPMKMDNRSSWTQLAVSTTRCLVDASIPHLKLSRDQITHYILRSVTDHHFISLVHYIIPENFIWLSRY